MANNISQSSRERVLQCIHELGSANRVFSRQRVAAMTGLKMSVVDDHLERLRDDSKIVKVLAGTYELVPEYPAPTPISYTPLDNGMVKIERGNSEWLMSPTELRIHAKMVAGWANELAGAEHLTEVAHTVNRLEQDVRVLRRAVKPSPAPSTVRPKRRSHAKLEAVS